MLLYPHTVLYAPARPPVWKLRKIGAVREQIGAAENVGHKKKLDAGAFTHEHEESYCIPTAPNVMKKKTMVSNSKFVLYKTIGFLLLVSGYNKLYEFLKEEKKLQAEQNTVCTAV